MLVHDGVATGVATGEWMRLYLFDVPEGSSLRVLAIAIVAPESRFERVVEAAAPIVDSVDDTAMSTQRATRGQHRRYSSRPSSGHLRAGRF